MMAVTGGRGGDRKNRKDSRRTEIMSFKRNVNLENDGCNLATWPVYREMRFGCSWLVF